MDKRTEANIRVKCQLEDALFSLMEEMPFSQITVSDLIRKAGVARNSYYRNFERKEDIVTSYTNRIRIDVVRAIAFRGILDDFLIEEKLAVCMEHYKLQRRRMLLLYQNGFAGYLQEDLNRFAEQYLGDMPQSSPSRYKLYFLSGAVLNVAIQWLKEGAKESPAQLAHVLVELMDHGVRTVE